MTRRSGTNHRRPGGSLTAEDLRLIIHEIRAPESAAASIPARTIAQWVGALGGALALGLMTWTLSTVLEVKQEVAISKERWAVQSATIARLEKLLDEPRFTERDFQVQIRPVTERLDRLASDFELVRREISKRSAAQN